MTQLPVQLANKVKNLELIIVAAVAASATALFIRRLLFDGDTKYGRSSSISGSIASSGVTQVAFNPLRDVSRQMVLKNYNVALVYGSQTGTAENLARRFARELHLEHHAETLVIDPEQFDLETLSKINPANIVVFLVATTGEGEAPDNFAKWYLPLIGEDIFTDDFAKVAIPEFIGTVGDQEVSRNYVFDANKPLRNLHFSVFGLGNSTYDHFNSPAKQLTKRLTSLGATLVGPLGLGDDDINIDDDFEKWTAVTAPLIAGHVISSNNTVDTLPKKYIPSWIVEEFQDPNFADKNMGTVRPPNAAINVSTSSPKVDSKNPWYTLPLNSRLLTHHSCDRRIIHMELDIKHGNMSYTTGDHVAVFPTNYETQVCILLKALNLKESQTISLKPSPYARNSAPLPYSISTYGSVLRHYMDITSPIPKNSIKYIMIPSASSEPAKEFLQKLVDDKDFYKDFILSPAMSPGELIQYIQKIEEEADTPSDLRFKMIFSALIDLLPRIIPRYYSISSSSLESPNKLTLTAAVLQYYTPNKIKRYGIATNYINAVHDEICSKSSNNSQSISSESILYNLEQTRKLTGSNSLAIPVYIRKSNFRLPPDPSVPIIMVGPGTGIAPFRGFIRERAFQVENSVKVGATVLFFGNRNYDKDFLYSDELPELFNTLSFSDKSSRLFTAFSRDQPEKIYVQHRIMENRSLVWDLLDNKKGHFYVCGDGKYMSKDVISTLKKIAQVEGKLDETRAESWFTGLKADNRYNEDTWH